MGKQKSELGRESKADRAKRMKAWKNFCKRTGERQSGAWKSKQMHAEIMLARAQKKAEAGEMWDEDLESNS